MENYDFKISKALDDSIKKHGYEATSRVVQKNFDLGKTSILLASFLFAAMREQYKREKHLSPPTWLYLIAIK